MSAVSRVSAFAKRRKLNGDSTAPTSGSDDSSSVSLTKDVKFSKGVTRGVSSTKHLRQKTTDIVHLEKNDERDSDGDENSFAPLVDAKAVSFTGTREIESFEDNSCRVRLSKGQKCSLQGIAKLWVQEGSVRINGAMLTESHETYTLFCSTSGYCTEIVAESKLAEFQLNSVSASEETLPSIANVPGRLGELGRRGVRSFHVPDRAQEGDNNSAESIASINGLVHAVSSHLRSTLRNDAADSRILICGKRSSDTFRASTALINNLLTSAFENRSHPARKFDKLAFLDLDYLSPAFSAPGTISIAILQNPVFGPSYTQPLPSDPKQPNYLLASHYIKAIEDSEKPNLNLSTVQNLLQTSQYHLRNTPLIIRTGSWFANTPTSDVPLLQKLLNPNLTVCIDAKKSSLYLEVAHSLCSSTSNTKSDTRTTSESMSMALPSILHHSIIPSATLSPLREHKLQLQSHFRIYGTIGETPLWYRDPLPDIPSTRRLVVSTDTSEPNGQGLELSFIQVHGGMLRAQDIQHAIRQNLVVIVAMQMQMQSGHDSHPTANSRPSQQQDLNRSRIHDASDLSHSFLPIRKVDDSQILHFVDLAFVEEVDVKGRLLTLNTPANVDRIRHYTSLGCEIGLVLEKPDTDGRFGRHLLFS